MKRLISLLLVFAMALPLCGCGKSKAAANAEKLISAIGKVTLDSGEAISNAQAAYDALTEKEKAQVENKNQLVEACREAEYLYGKEAYDKICEAWKIASQAGDDLYIAWYACVNEQERNKLIKNGVEYLTLSGNCPLDQEILIEGFAKAMYQFETTGGLSVYDDSLDGDWENLRDSERNYYREAVQDKRAFVTYGVSYYAFHGILRAYAEPHSPLEAAHAALDDAKQSMQTLLEQFADYEYYPKLKGLYTTTNSMLEYLALTASHGSLEQYNELLKGYKKEARDYMSDLDFIFAN